MYVCMSVSIIEYEGTETRALRNTYFTVRVEINGLRMIR